MKQMKQMKQQSGFTLVELVTTMVIVGTLAAVAVPKFADAAKDARITKLEQLRNSVRNASAATHALLSQGKIDTSTDCPGETDSTSGAKKSNNSQGATGTVCTEGGVAKLVYGYPATGAVMAADTDLTVANTGIINVAGLTGKFRPTAAEINKAGFGASVTNGVVTFSVTGGSGTVTASASTTGLTASENSTCKFTYTPAASAGAEPVLGDLTTSGC